MDKTSNNILIGYGDGPREMHTPEVMRDCIRKHFWEMPVKADLFRATGWLADDLKRRGFTRQKTLEIIQGHLTLKFNCLKPTDLKQIQTKVEWVYNTQTHGLTCTGALDRAGLCHKSKNRCHFHELNTAARQWIKSLHPVVLPDEIKKRLDKLHPTDVSYAGWTYLELFRLEQENGLLPGNPKEPILIGFRPLAVKVTAHNKSPGFDRHHAVKYVRLLEDIGVIKTVVKGKAGTIGRRMANGYIRLIPISPIYNSESEIRDSICVQDAPLSKNNNQEDICR